MATAGFAAASDQNLAVFVEHAPVAVAMFDRDMRYVIASRKWKADHKLDDRDLRGLSHYDVFPEISDEWKRIHARGLAGEVVRSDSERFVRNDGSVQVLRWEVRPWRNHEGEIGGIFIFTEDLSAITLAYEEAREKEEWLRIAQSAAHAGTREWNLTTGEARWSDEVWDLLGLTKGAEPSRALWLSAIVPEDRDRVDRLVRESAAREEEIALSYLVRWKDGSIHHLASREYPFRDSDGVVRKYLGLIIDITAQKRADTVLMEREKETSVRNLLANAVEGIQDGLAVFDKDDRVVFANSVYCALVGTTPRDIQGRSYAELLDRVIADLDLPDDEARARFREQRLVQRKERTATFNMRRRSGISLRISDRPTADDGIVSTIWDLTEDERRATDLYNARIAAEAGSAAKTDFLSSMSHELRTPLNAILGFAQLLERDKKTPLNDRQKMRINQILNGGYHLLRLIDDILDLSRIEGGGISMSIEPMSIREVLDEVRASLEPIAERSGIRLMSQLPNVDLPFIAADRTRFAQILMNFGSNAIKYNRPSGEVTFSISMLDPKRARVSVKDTGLGIAAQHQHKLFQPFERAGQETGPIEGTGIGLFITKRLAELMGAEIGFRSTPGVGSEFWVDVPVSASARPSLTTLRRAAEARRTSSGEPKLLLYVEDNPANVSFMKDLVGTLDNVDLLVAETAESGMRTAFERKPDVILMDINLPGISGIDALRRLKATPETRDIPVVALTAAATEGDRKRGESAGFYRYLTKPVDIDDFVATIHSIFASGEVSATVTSATLSEH